MRVNARRTSSNEMINVVRRLSPSRVNRGCGSVMIENVRSPGIMLGAWSASCENEMR